MASRASTELKERVARTLRRLYRVASAEAPNLHEAFDRLESGAEMLSARSSAIEQELARLRSSLDELAASMRVSLDELAEGQSRHYRLALAQYDDIARLREQLRTVRRSEAYDSTFANREPLVSVPIATYNLSSTLIDRAIASVRAQTYPRWEIVVVGDGCTDDTAERVEELGDPRIRFVNLPFRTPYPDDSSDAWLVSGTMPYNRAVELCRGDWIAPLDDDDEFLPGHIATLLELALERRAEFVYGALAPVTEPQRAPRPVPPRDSDDGFLATVPVPERVALPAYLFAFPPAHGAINLQASVYLRSLDFFECDFGSWIVGEPVDWNLIRRMLTAGVIMAATEEVVTRYYPSSGRHH